MENLSIVEGNKILGEFMGVLVQIPYPDNKEEIHYHYDFGTCTHKSDYKSPDGKRHHTDVTVKYHSSWDWLMPVIDKVNELSAKSNEDCFIRSRYEGVVIGAEYMEIGYSIYSLNWQKSNDETRIQMVWNGLIEFITNLKNGAYKI